MQLVLTEDQEFIAKTAEDFVAEKSPISRVRELRDSADATGFSRELWKEMADLGWAGIPFAEELGGADLGMAEFVDGARGARSHPRAGALPLHGAPGGPGAPAGRKREPAEGVASRPDRRRQDPGPGLPGAEQSLRSRFRGDEGRAPGRRLPSLRGEDPGARRPCGRRDHRVGEHPRWRRPLPGAEGRPGPGDRPARAAWICRNAAIVKLDGVSVAKSDLVGEIGAGGDLLERGGRPRHGGTLCGDARRDVRGPRPDPGAPQDPRAVRRPDRQLPGAEAPGCRHVHRGRAVPFGGDGRRARGGRGERGRPEADLAGQGALLRSIRPGHQRGACRCSAAWG